jgi:hypothetical protein
MTGPTWHLFVPKLFTILRQGYSFDWFRANGTESQRPPALGSAS